MMMQIPPAIRNRSQGQAIEVGGFNGLPTARLTLATVLAAGLLAGCAGALDPVPAASTTMLDRAEPIATPQARAVLPEPIVLDSSDAALAVEREPWSFGGNRGLKITTPNYTIHTTIDYENILQRLPEFYEAALDHYTTAITDLPRPRVPLESYIFRTGNEWKAKTRQMLPDEYATFQHLGRGGFATRGIAVLYYIDTAGRSRSTLSIAAHEGWHQYSQTTFRNPLPIWLEEGLAAYMESFRLSRTGTASFQPSYNRERSRALRDAAHEGRLVDLDELLTHTPQSFLQKKGRDALLVYYAQVWALARFLAEGNDGHYRQGLEDLLQDAAAGRLAGRLLRSTALPSGRQRRAAVSSRVGRAAVLEYFNRDWAEFEDEYDAYVQRMTGTAGRRGRTGSR